MSQDAFLTPPPRDTLPESVATDTPDPRIARAEQRLAMLRELAEIGMDLARNLPRRSHETLETPEAAPDADTTTKPAPKPAPSPRHDPADSFARLTRAIRLTFALEAVVEDRLSALRAGTLDQAKESPRAAVPSTTATGDAGEDLDFYAHLPRDYPSAYRNTIRDAVFDVVNREVTDLREAQKTLDALYEHLIEGERYDAFVHRPLKEAVEAICEDLGLHPDWTHWTDDGWSATAERARYRWQDIWGPTTRSLSKRRLQ